MLSSSSRVRSPPLAYGDCPAPPDLGGRVWKTDPRRWPMGVLRTWKGEPAAVPPERGVPEQAADAVRSGVPTPAGLPPAMQSFGRGSAANEDDDADARLDGAGDADDRDGKAAVPFIRRSCIGSCPDGVKGESTMPPSSSPSRDRLLGVHCPGELPVDVDVDARDLSGDPAAGTARRTWGDDSGEFSSSDSPSGTAGTSGTAHGGHGGHPPPSPLVLCFLTGLSGGCAMPHDVTDGTDATDAKARR
mmetsp:Transcript_24314/g.54356  ORF Transcript_24314/g.54356 Transcript_24314/m.54356 type:complete len:246 (+) Transcript_24314:813-1550(+)